MKSHFFFFNKGNKQPSAYEVTSASKYLFDQVSAGRSLPRRIVLTVVESFSLFQEDRINDMQLIALKNEELSKKYHIIQGTVPFNGSTVPGELRELCRVQVSAVIPDTALLPIDQCLPRYLGSMGYESISIHGFSGFFFDRFRWYPKLGFEKSLFMFDIDKELGITTRCGSTFRASCDHMTLSIIKDNLQNRNREKLFLYWLTINGHLPVSNTENSFNTLDCAGIKELQTHPALCSSVKIGDSVIRGLVEIALDEELPETLFIIVGDHMAPYLNKQIRATMSDTLVPYAVLVPKTKSKL